jgi:hypothetical protein
MLSGWKTYAVAAVIIAAVVIEKGVGIDVPGIVITDDWAVYVLNALGLGFLRAGISTAAKGS